MKTQLLDQTDLATLSTAIEFLRMGRVVSFPTDTVYGLAVLVGAPRAIEKLYQIKGRSFDKPIPVMVSRLDQLDTIVSSIPLTARRLADKYWPGPLTLVLPKRADLPANLTPLPSVGVRIPNHAFALALLDQCGPLAVTSANRSGKPETQSALEVLAQLGGRLELVVDGGRSPGGIASTVVDLTGSSPRILREGPISRGMIDQILKELDS